MTVKITVLFACLLATASAFVAPSTKQHSTATFMKKSNLDNNSASFDPLGLSTTAAPSKVAAIAAAATAAIIASPLAAIAEEADDYEYGAVDAPIGIAVGGGILAILTALLPVALKGGEEAFEEMKDRDSEGWGTGSTNALNSKKRR
mmetsp:Transcript_29599/g.44062  ORF Transcript_29599/g.44062 Transcript_29599/m.44062 type:complete len:147 (-) Transcript_29599:223-663(-)